MAESVTGSTGGVSISTMSYSALTARRNSAIALGGQELGRVGRESGPASMMCRLSRPGAAMMSSISKRPIRMSATVRMQSRQRALPTRMSLRARLALDAEEPVDARAAQVGADQQPRLLAVLGHGEREVDDGGGLALLQRWGW